MAPPPGVVGAHVRIQRIVAIGGQQFGGLQAFFDVAAFFDEALAGQGALAPVLDHALDAEAQRHGETLAAARLDLLHDLAGKAQAVLQGAAVGVVAQVEHGDGELVEQVTLVHGVYLDAVKAGALCVGRAIAEGFDDAVDLLHRQRAADLVQPTVRYGRGRHRRELAQVGGDGHAAKAGGHHQEDLAAVGVDTLGHLAAGAHEVHGVVGGIGAVGHALRFHLAVGERHAGDDEPRAAAGAGSVVVDAALVPAAFRVGQPQRAHGCHREAVPDLAVADLDGRKQLFVLQEKQPP